MKDVATVDVIARALYRAHCDAVERPGPAAAFDFDILAEGQHQWVEGWHAVARAAIELGARPRSTDQRERLAELLGTDSTNFLGTGLAFREFLKLHSAEKLSRSWSLQPREEQRRRLTVVVRLSAELERIRETENFATGLAEMAIEAVIEGDWKMVEEWAEHFAFKCEGEDLRQKYVPVFANFRELLLQALRAEKGVPT